VCNLDALNPDFVSLLRGVAGTASDGAEGAGSMNPFVKGLFSGKAIAMQDTLFDTLGETQNWYVFCNAVF